MISKILMKVIKPVIDRLTPTCDTVAQQISRSMDEPLSWTERVQVRVHIMACKFCARYRRQLLAIRQKIRQHTDVWEDGAEPSGVHLSPEARERMKRKLTGESPDS